MEATKGKVSPIIGGAISGATVGLVGVAVSGAINEVFGGGNVGNVGCYSSGCHGIEK